MSGRGLFRRKRTKAISFQRVKKLFLKKAKAKHREIAVSCAMCTALGRQVVIAAHTDAEATARLLAHYQQAHPSVLSSGGVPVVGQCAEPQLYNPKAEVQHEPYQEEAAPTQSERHDRGRDTAGGTAATGRPIH